MRIPTLLTLSVLCLSAGCGSDESPVGPPKPEVGPHGGPVVALSEARGFAEVVVEPPKSGAASQQRLVAVYFLGPDLNASLAPLPKVVKVNLRIRGKDEPIRLALKPEPDSRFAYSESRFASEARALPIEQLTGELNVAFGGEEQTIPFVGRR